MEIKTNKNKLIEQAVLGEISHPSIPKGREWRINPAGRPVALPGVGGITYNCKVGELATGRQADHVEPGVSLKTDKTSANNALNILACIGNEATVVSGDAKGKRGVVTGKHGGIEHVLIDFAQSTLDKLVIGDKIQIRACGLGLELNDFPSISVTNSSASLIESICTVVPNNKLQVPVILSVPAELMGSGIGHSHVFSGDYDIQFSDQKVVEQLGLDQLRLGDLIAIKDQHHAYGRSYKKGAVSIGVVVHTSCTQSGHGPGITSLLSCDTKALELLKDDKANIAEILGIGTARLPENDGSKQ